MVNPLKRSTSLPLEAPFPCWLMAIIIQPNSSKTGLILVDYKSGGVRCHRMFFEDYRPSLKIVIEHVLWQGVEVNSRPH